MIGATRLAYIMVVWHQQSARPGEERSMSTRLTLPARRNHVTQKVKIASQRTLYISVHDDEQPAEIFLRLPAEIESRISASARPIPDPINNAPNGVPKHT